MFRPPELELLENLASLEKGQGNVREIHEDGKNQGIWLCEMGVVRTSFNTV